MLKHNRNNSEQCGQTLVEESSVTEPGDTQPPVMMDASSELSMTFMGKLKLPTQRGMLTDVITAIDTISTARIT